MPALTFLAAWLETRRPRRHDDRGSAELTTMIALSFVAVVAVVAIVGLLQILGADIVGEVRERIGLSG